MPLLPQSVRRFVSKAFSLAGKEQAALAELHQESRAAVRRMCEKDPGLQRLLDEAYGYAVFPSVGKATAVVGGAFGKGEVFQRGKLIGYAGLVQLTLGVQLGGQTFRQIVAFRDQAALARFKAGRTAFAANASAVLVKAGAAASAGYESGALVFLSSEGGMMLEAAIGAQKFIFKPAALGRTKTAPRPPRNKPGAAAAKSGGKPADRAGRAGRGGRAGGEAAKTRSRKSASPKQPGPRRAASRPATPASRRRGAARGS